MTCAEIRLRLDDYVDGSLPEGELHDVELHLADCPSCREEASRIHALVLAAASLPRELLPDRELWGGIKARLSRENLSSARRGPLALLPALAAALAVLAALLSVFLRGAPEAPKAIAGVQAASTLGQQEHVQEAEVDYLKATSQLTLALDARRGSLSRETQAAVDENMRVIDEALRQVRLALEKDPGNRQLTKLLASTHQKKLDLLVRLLKLSAQI